MDTTRLTRVVSNFLYIRGMKQINLKEWTPIGAGGNGKTYKSADDGDALKDENTCLHGDFNPGNLIVSPKGDWWIDLGRFSYGDPLLDIAHLYMFCNEGRDSWIVRKVIEHISHMKFSQLQSFWDAFLDAEGITDKAGFDKMIQPYLALDKLVRHGFQHSDRLKKNVLRSIRKAMN